MDRIFEGLRDTLPLDAQGGIQGGLETSVRFGSNSTPHLDSDFRRNDEVMQSSRRGQIPRSTRYDMGLLVSTTAKTPLYSRLGIKGEGWEGLGAAPCHSERSGAQ